MTPVDSLTKMMDDMELWSYFRKGDDPRIGPAKVTPPTPVPLPAPKDDD